MQQVVKAVDKQGNEVQQSTYSDPPDCVTFDNNENTHDEVYEINARQCIQISTATLLQTQTDATDYRFVFVGRI